MQQIIVAFIVMGQWLRHWCAFGQPLAELALAELALAELALAELALAELVASGILVS
ncbi:hypothetical protein [Pseudosulfitobacter sp. SM2401]|uniref:hypothetical protein n=1 Tax=Pseudosulfitobacter sp. SM2401 TaxID=3350098 RepID=UPI0036F34E30